MFHAVIVLTQIRLPPQREISSTLPASGLEIIWMAPMAEEELGHIAGGFLAMRVGLKTRTEYCTTSRDHVVGEVIGVGPKTQ